MVAIVCLPFCIGFGLIAFAPLGPEHTVFAIRAGLAGGIASGVVASLLGGTRGQISAPIIAGALLIAELVGSLWVDPRLPVGAAERLSVCLGMVSATVFAAGLLQVAFGVLRLGVVVRYLAYPVVTGLMAAVAVLTAQGQLVEFLGPGGFAGWRAAPLSPAALATLLTGAATLVVVVFGGRVLPRVPGPLKGLVIGMAVGQSLRFLGGPALAVPVLAPVASALPRPIDPLPALELLGKLGPAWVVDRLLGPALSIALFSSLNSLLAASAVDAVSGHEHDPNRELIGQGSGNLAASIFAGLPGGGLASLSTLNWQSGGKSRLAGVAHGVTLLLFLVACGPLVVWIPRVVLAAIVVVAAVGLFDPWILKLLQAARDPLRKADRAGTWVCLGLIAAVAASVLVAGLVWGIVVGVLASSAHFILRVGRVRYRLAYRGNEVHSKRARPLRDLEVLAEAGKSIAVFELAGQMFFGSADRLIKRVVRDAEGARTIVLGLRGVDEIDASGLRVLLNFIARMKRAGRQVLIGHLTVGHPLWPRLADMGVGGNEIGRQFFTGTDAALEWAEDRLLEEARAPSDATGELALGDTDLLRGLPSELIDWLERHVTRQRFARGAVVVSTGATDRSLYWVLAGRVSVVATEGRGEPGEATRLAGFGAGTAFGEIALLDSGPRSASVVAEEDTACAVLSAESFAELCRDHPELAVRLLESLSLGLSHRLRAATEQIRALLVS
jgi:SulP family sulfate permease